MAAGASLDGFVEALTHVVDFTSGAAMQIWVIDVGGTIVVIDGESFPYRTDAVKGELKGIVSRSSLE